MAKNSIIERIANSGLTIYDELDSRPEFRIPTPELERILRDALQGLDTRSYPIRSRSKFIKQEVCKAMGYPVPPAFRKTQPRFFGQDMDTYVQKSRNLQIWNEAIPPNRRYAIVIVDPEYLVKTVYVLRGDEVAKLDLTGSLTSKHQAILRKSVPGLISKTDTATVRRAANTKRPKTLDGSPIQRATLDKILPIQQVYERLKRLEGTRLKYVGASGERNRGFELHKAACLALGYKITADDGRFPDIAAQLIELKLQTSQTIDLGWILPDSESPFEDLILEGIPATPSDVRYAVFDATHVADRDEVILNKVFLVCGADFFSAFDLMQGIVVNKKLQMPLPASFFV